MAVLVKTCCCGCSLRAGVMILGFLGLIGSAYSIYQHSQSIKVDKYVGENADEISQDLPFSKKHLLAIVILTYVSLVFGVISLLVNLLLLGSCSSSDKRLAFPWLGWSIFKLFFSFGVFIFYIDIWDGFADVFIVYIIEWLLLIYFIIVVYSYIEALRQDPSGTSAGFSPPQTGGNQTHRAGMECPPYVELQGDSV
ncbi:uncharacterized protein [Pocillopora verrucosa]|uniref:uncharacterized protein isoform X1 n=1 Tax=Pocillopora verrucosa TaxID=203993 RepID=UPI003341CD94